MNLAKISLSLSTPRGGSSVITSDITSMEIMGATPLLDATNDYGDATARTGINGDGWIAKATMPYLVGQTFDPTKITFTVQDAGYDATTSTTVTRTITGTKILRRQYSAQASNQIANDGITFTVYFAIDDDIYDRALSVTATAASGFYGGSVAGAVASVTNSSTAAYEKPLFGWFNIQHERADSSTFNVEAVAFHRRAQSGRQVARIEFIAKDAQGTPNVAATQTASSTSLSSFQTAGNICEVYKAAIPMTNLTQADVCQVNVKVYPWLGDSTAVLDLDTDGIAWPTARPITKLRFLNDKNGTYGGAHAMVQIGGTATGTTGVGATYAAALALAAPYGTLDAALAAVQSYNSTNKSHNDHSGSEIWMMETTPGAGADHAWQATSTRTAGNCMTNVRTDPAASGTVRIVVGATGVTTSMLRFFCQVRQNGAFSIDGGSAGAGDNKLIAFENTTLSHASSAAAPLIRRVGLGYYRNVTVTGATATEQAPWGTFSSDIKQSCLVLGCNFVPNSTSVQFKTHPYVYCGNYSEGAIFDEFTSGAATQDGLIVYNNKLMKQGTNGATTSKFGHIRAFSLGLAMVQNVGENIAVNFNLMQISGDSTTFAMDNVISMYNTLMGRNNHMYSDVAGSAGVIKRMITRFDLFDSFALKTDTFTTITSVTGRHGNHRMRYFVGCSGLVTFYSSVVTNANALGANDWLGEVAPSNSVLASNGGVTFTDDQHNAGLGGGVLMPGGGTYSLTGASNDAYDRVGSGLAGLTKDISGAARLNDGTGAAGAYERP